LKINFENLQVLLHELNADNSNMTNFSSWRAAP